jgi:hypothetical protein
MSMGLFVVRLAHDRRKVLVVKLFAGVCAAFALAHILVVGIRGNYAKPWRILDGTQFMVKIVTLPSIRDD